MNRLIEVDYHYSKDLQKAFEEVRNAKFAYDSQRALEELDAFMDEYDNYDIVLGYYDVTTETFIKDTVLNDDGIDALMDITSANIIEKLLDYHGNFGYTVDACVRLESNNSILTLEYNGYELRLDYY
jgi:hypothetical protein